MKQFKASRVKSLALPLWMCLFAFFSSQSQADQPALQKIHNWIQNEHPIVNHIRGNELERNVRNNENFVLFDVRERAEYDVSHLANAIQVDPEISAATFSALYGETLKDKTVVFYCSVGRRSSLLAEKVHEDLSAQGANQILNLEHGIFGWHNEIRQLEDRSDEITDFVHPYSWRWGRLLERKDLIRYDLE